MKCHPFLVCLKGCISNLPSYGASGGDGRTSELTVCTLLHFNFSFALLCSKETTPIFLQLRMLIYILNTAGCMYYSLLVIKRMLF